MIKLSVNINKFATIRNSRGGDNPNVLKAALDAETFGADGVTVHPRPDERHIRYADVRAIKPALKTEFNIEGNCREKKFVDLVLEVKPHQVTLVPDALGQLTSDHGWDTIAHKDYLKEIIAVFKNAGIRTSIFVDPDVRMIDGAVATGTDRVELYTESYATGFLTDKENAIAPFIVAAKRAKELGLGINAGHDLDLHNLKFFAQHLPFIDEVSIGHALVCDALYLGLRKRGADVQKTANDCRRLMLGAHQENFTPQLIELSEGNFNAHSYPSTHKKKRSRSPLFSVE